MVAAFSSWSVRVEKAYGQLLSCSQQIFALTPCGVRGLPKWQLASCLGPALLLEEGLLQGSGGWPLLSGRARAVAGKSNTNVNYLLEECLDGTSSAV